MFVRRRKEVTKGAPGVYVTLDELAGLEHRARGFSFLPRQPIHSLLTGRHGSRMRGRGLNFEELRGYLPGDDPRTIDWKVTARTGKPHVRVFTEERDRPGIVVVDQRKSMFFGSRLMMKSVTAAHVAALGAWRLFAGGDRVGAFVFNDETIEEIRPHRSRNAVMRILGEIVRQNHALAADSTVPGDPGALPIATLARWTSGLADADLQLLPMSHLGPQAPGLGLLSAAVMHVRSRGSVALRSMV